MITSETANHICAGPPRTYALEPRTESEIMKWTTLTFKELAAQKTLRMDAKYWIKKKKRRATSHKRQAASLTDPAIQDKIGPEQKG